MGEVGAMSPTDSVRPEVDTSGAIRETEAAGSETDAGEYCATPSTSGSTSFSRPLPLELTLPTRTHLKPRPVNLARAR